MAENINYRKITKAESEYLGEWDLPVDGSDAVYTIADAVQETVKIPAKNISQEKLVISFVETNKKFVCNNTNGALISKALGTPNLSEWVGKKIQLYSNNKVKFGSSTVSAIRVRPEAPRTINPEYHCSVCGVIIPENTYKQSVAKYGKAYCSKECLDDDTKGKDVL